MGTVAQIVGLILLAIAGWLLWSPWSFAIAGGVLVVAPEIGALRRP